MINNSSSRGYTPCAAPHYPSELDSDEKLYYGAPNNGKTAEAFFDCSLHWKHKDRCGTHLICESVPNRMVLRHIQLVTGYRQYFISVMGQKEEWNQQRKSKLTKSS